MKMQTRRIIWQTERAFVADEMDFVSTRGKFLAQGRGKNPAPADGGITGDADLQWTQGGHVKIVLHQGPIAPASRARAGRSETARWRGRFRRAIRSAARARV